MQSRRLCGTGTSRGLRRRRRRGDGDCEPKIACRVQGYESIHPQFAWVVCTTYLGIESCLRNTVFYSLDTKASTREASLLSAIRTNSGNLPHPSFVTHFSCNNVTLASREPPLPSHGSVNSHSATSEQLPGTTSTYCYRLTAHWAGAKFSMPSRSSSHPCQTLVIYGLCTEA